jgi:dTMP kinase
LKDRIIQREKEKSIKIAILPQGLPWLFVIIDSASPDNTPNYPGALSKYLSRLLAYGLLFLYTSLINIRKVKDFSFSLLNINSLFMENSLFITFEGIEGCGKTTQIIRLAKRLEKRGVQFVSTREPGGTRIGKDIRNLLLDARNTNLFPLAELILYAADRAQHVEEIIRPALDQGKWVICDRFFDATVAYQGAGRGLDMDIIMTLNDKVTKGLSPDLTLLLDCPPEKGIERALNRNSSIAPDGQDRFEREKMDFHRKVRDAYLDLSRKEKRFTIINASLPEDSVEKEIFSAIEPYLATVGK